jgi:hypothetical protein
MLGRSDFPNANSEDRGTKVQQDGRRHLGAGRFVALILLLISVAVSGLSFSQQADATPVLRFQETFGGSTPPPLQAPTSLAVDQSTGDLLVVDNELGTISRFRPDGTPAPFSALGTNVISEAGGPRLSFGGAGETQIAVDESGTQTDGDIYVTQSSEKVVDIFASTGTYLGQLTASGAESFGEPCGVAVNKSSDIYIGDFPQGIHKFVPTANPPLDSDSTLTFPEPKTPNGPCTVAAGAGPTIGFIFPAEFGNKIYKQDASTGAIRYALSNFANTTETVDPKSGHVFGADSNDDNVREYDASGSNPVELGNFALATTPQGVAVSSAGNIYVSRQNSSQIEVWRHVPLPTTVTLPVAHVLRSGATLEGEVDPEGVSLTGCEFEYGLASHAGYEKAIDCEPPAGAIGTNPHHVSASLIVPANNSTYRVRLRAINANGAEVGQEREFTTFGPPQIEEERARDATERSANLEATIDASGFPTSYRFEWGQTAAYGNSIPPEGFIPLPGTAGESPTVSAEITGLVAAGTYHYRVVSTSGEGREVVGPDRVFETLNSCGLPEERCFELVSPRETGPIDLAGHAPGTYEPHYQASPASGRFGYVSEIGLPDATKGSEVFARAIRGSVSWESTQISPPNTAVTQGAGGSQTSSIKWINPELTCDIVESNQPLTSDPGTRLAVEWGGANLYRRSPDGTYTALTIRPPTNVRVPYEEKVGLPSFFAVQGVSDDCERVIFSSQYRYPGISPSAQNGRHTFFYEWTEDALRPMNYGTNGEILEEPSLPDHNPISELEESGLYNYNVVSENGAKVFFNANRVVGNNEEEDGKQGVFVREAGIGTRDISVSETTVPDLGAKFQFATADGSKAFFTANAGLTQRTNASGRDLYEYNLLQNRLRDLSVGSAGEEAAKTGFIGASRDGSRVYFAALGQLVPGKGESLAVNLARGQVSLYETEANRIQYVGAVAAALIGQTTADPSQTARVSEDGQFLVYESTLPSAGYADVTEAHEAYVYDAETATTECVSCRPDGGPSSLPRGSQVLTSPSFSVGAILGNPVPTNAPNSPYPARTLVVRGGRPIVFFNSTDVLAPKTQEGINTVYEWARGQVFKIFAEKPGLNNPPQNEPVGSSADGTDLYLSTTETLSWEDPDERSSVYDARIGGGFPQPDAPAPPCSPSVEGGCNGTVSQSQAPPAVETNRFDGPSNPPGEKTHKKSHKKKKRHKKSHHHKKKHRGRGQNTKSHRGGKTSPDGSRPDFSKITGRSSRMTDDGEASK